VFPEEALGLVELIKAADNAMYAEKSRKKTRDDPRRLDDRVASIVSDLVPLLTSPGSLADKLNLVAARLSAGTGYDAVDCEIFEETEALPQIQYTTVEGEIEPLSARWHAEVQRAHRTPGQSVISQLLARTRRPIILDDLLQDERISQTQRDLLAQRGLRSALIAPMFWQDNLVGTLSVGRKEKAAFHLSDAQFLAAVANQTTAIVRMATLVDNLQRAGERLQDAQAETVLMLAAAAEAHDHTTGVHLENIRTLSEAICRELGYEEQQVREIGLAAALHDIGKISVPDVILSSPIRFETDDWETARMWDVMKQHSVWGAEFLRGRHGFELAANVARWHHERWDGTGYPDQLVGELIPQEVAVVTVADAFDAMVSDRPYRQGRPVAEAIEEVQRWSGRQFSPVVVDALVRLYRARRLPTRHDGQALAA
jgi:HD-GYP domain-containing protein (c-di-GMP phosphodiesterase class II)